MFFKESIHIKNVGPIRDLEIKDIRPLTVLIGASATGKSTLMKVLALMRYIYKMENIRSYLLDSTGIQRSPFRLEFKNLLKDGLMGAFSKDSEVEYTAYHRDRSYTICYKGGKLQNKMRIATEHLLFFKEAYVVEERGAMAAFLSERSDKRQKLGTEDLPTVRSKDLGFYFNDTLKDLQHALNESPNLSIKHLGVLLAVKKGRDNKKRYLISNQLDKEMIEIDLKYSSSGIQASTPIVSLLQYFARDFSFERAVRRSIFSYLWDDYYLQSLNFQSLAESVELPRHVHLYIEEPELNLFPTAQCALLNLAVEEAFVNKKEDRELSLMIATHSPYIANYINVLLRKSRLGETGLCEEDFDVYLLVDGKAISLIGEDEDTHERVVDTLPLTEAMEEIYNEYVSLGDHVGENEDTEEGTVDGSHGDIYNDYVTIEEHE